MYSTHTLATQFRHIPNGIPLAEQTYYFPIFGFYLFCRFYRTNLASEFSTFLYIASVLTVIKAFMSLYRRPVKQENKKAFFTSS